MSPDLGGQPPAPGRVFALAVVGAIAGGVALGVWIFFVLAG